MILSSILLQYHIHSIQTIYRLFFEWNILPLASSCVLAELLFSSSFLLSSTLLLQPFHSTLSLITGRLFFQIILTDTSPCPTPPYSTAYTQNLFRAEDQDFGSPCLCLCLRNSNVRWSSHSFSRSFGLYSTFFTFQVLSLNFNSTQLCCTLLCLSSTWPFLSAQTIHPFPLRLQLISDRLLLSNLSNPLHALFLNLKA